MRRITRLFTELDQTNKTAEKIAAIERYFRETPPADAAWGLFFLSGQRLKRVAKTAVVQEAAIKATGMSRWMLGECYEAVGDLSETIALLLPEEEGDGLDEPLHVVVERRVVPLVQSDDRAAAAMLLDAWAGMNGAQRFVFNKLVRGNFRVGVQKALVVRALAAALEVDPAIMAHRLSGEVKPTAAAFAGLIGDGESDAAKPYPLCLAHQLNQPIEKLGDPKVWQVEFKWDGIRAQIVRRDGVEGGVAIWSRGEEPVAHQFPEIAGAARLLPSGTVLDGEILAWSFEGSGRPLSFNVLQNRLNRKDAQAGLFDTQGVAFAAFDILEHEGRDVRGLALRERRRLLNAMVGAVQERSGDRLRASRAMLLPTWEEVARLRGTARDEHGTEGLMLKHLESMYHAGRVSGGTMESIAADGGRDAGWWKWKVDPYSVDAVLIYAQQGSGRRAGLYTDYTFGVWDPDASGELTPFAKAYSGLNNDEIKRADTFIRANTIGKAGPMRMVKPELVFEISFEAIQESARHKSGIAVRFPRITRWRTDKTADQADTIGTVRALLAAAKLRDEGRGSAAPDPNK